MSDGKKVSGFQLRLNKARIRHPELSEVALRSLVMESYKAKDPEARARQTSGLLPGGLTAAQRAKRPAAKPKPKADGVLDFRGMNVIDFARDCLHLKLYPSQCVALKATYGLEMTRHECALYRQIAGGQKAPHEPGREAVEAVLCVGARSGKSLLMSVMAIYEALVKGDQWRKHLRPGELGYGIVVATRLQQAQDIIQGNAARLLLDSPELRDQLATEPTQTKIELKNGLCIMSLPCNSTAGRGLPCFFLGIDEVAHFYTEGVKADEAIYASLSPRLAQFPGAKTILASTPAARQGLFYEWHSEGFDVPGRATFQGGTVLFNPEIDHAYLARLKARDPDNYAREFEAQFCEAMAAYFAHDTIEAALVLPGDVAPVADVAYFLAIDQSGLSGKDRFGAAVSHADEQGAVVVDAVRSWDARDLDSVMTELSALARAYGIKTCLRDQYAAGWVSSSLARVGLDSETRPTLPTIYANMKSLLLGGNVRLPENQELRAGLVNTQASFGRNNSMSIVHQRGRDGHADLADAVVTACWAASGRIDDSDRAFTDSMLEGIMEGELCTTS